MRRLCLMLLCLAGFLAAVAAVNWIVNPYGAWRSTAVDPAYRFSETTRNEAGERVTTAYRIRAEQPTNLLVGSSRVVVGMYIERGARDGVFNASMSGASLAEIAAILRLATSKSPPEARDLGRRLLRVRREVRWLPPPRNTHAARGRRAAGHGHADQGDAAQRAGAGRQPEGATTSCARADAEPGLSGVPCRGRRR